MEGPGWAGRTERVRLSLAAFSFHIHVEPCEAVPQCEVGQVLGNSFGFADDS